MKELIYQKYLAQNEMLVKNVKPRLISLRLTEEWTDGNIAAEL